LEIREVELLVIHIDRIAVNADQCLILVRYEV